MALTSILERLRAALERSASVSGKELRADVASLMDAIPDTDDALLADGGEQGATLSGGTLAQLIGLPQSETPAASADAAASQSASLAPIALALGIETTDARELAVAIMSLKSNTVPAERVRELEARLAAAEERSGEERIVAEITRQRSAGKQITPAFETELLRVAKSDVGLALSSLAGLQVTSIDLATQADAPAPTVDRLETARQRAAERLAELPGIASGAQKASAAAHEETLAIASERGVTYAQANRIRLESVQVKAAA